MIKNINIWDEIFQNQIEALIELKTSANIKLLNNIVNLIANNKGKIIISGIGKSGYIGKKIASSFSSTGSTAIFLHPSEASHGDLGIIQKQDIVILISNSGNTQELKDILDYCTNNNITSIGITSGKNSLLVKNSNYIIYLPKTKEISSLGAPTTSALLTLAIGDALMVCVHEKKLFKKSDYKHLHPGGSIGSKLQTVGNIMHKGNRLPIVTKRTLISDVILKITEKGSGIAIILGEDSKIVEGIVTDGDLRRNMGSNLLSLYAEEVMTKTVQTIREETLIEEALDIMNNKSITSLIIVNPKKELLGFVHIHDVLRILS